MPAVATLKGIGADLSAKLERLGIRNVEDLLFHFPYRYQDRTRVHPLKQLKPGQELMTEGTISQVGLVYRRKRMLLVTLEDGNARLLLRFFHFSTAQRNNLKKGLRLLCFGEVRRNGLQLEMVHPEYRLVDPHRPFPMERGFVPVYPTTEGLMQQGLRRLTQKALHWLDSTGHELEELLPAELLVAENLPALSESIH